jgi:hypothetical protein
MRFFKKVVTVEKIIEENDNYQVITTLETSSPAYVFKKFSGRATPGEKVILNFTATKLKLGTGGYDFVVGILRDEQEPFEDEILSHLIKLNYTPYQFSTTVVEETEAYHQAVIQFDKHKMIKSAVAVLTIHSHLLPFLLGLKKEFHNVRSVVVLDDSTCLPAFLSSLLNYIFNQDLVFASITTGHAFGGTYEALNIPSALIFASFSLEADVIVCAPGFGLKGTGSKFGHTAVRSCEALFYAESLGATPYLVPRISFAEKRERHHGLSHHTVEIMQIKKDGFKFLLPQLNYPDLDAIFEKLPPFNGQILSFPFATEDAIQDLSKHREKLVSMGRSLNDDPYFFVVPYACGCYLGRLLNEAF